MTDALYRLVAAILRVVFALLGIRPRVTGLDHLPARGPAVVVANHLGYLDFALVGYVGRRRRRWVRFLAKEAVFEIPVVGAAMRTMGHVPVAREQGAGALRQATRALDRGEVVGVFAEGTISRSFLVKGLLPGAAAMALASGAPIVPVVGYGGQRLVSVDLRLVPRWGAPVLFRVGEPLRPQPDEDAQALTARLRERMLATLEEVLDDYALAAGERSAGAWWWPHARGGGAPPPDVAAERDRAALDRIEARRQRKEAGRDDAA